MGADSGSTDSAPTEKSGLPRDAVSVIVADDDVLLREGLASLLGALPVSTRCSARQAMPPKLLL